jgi:acyl-CoA thioesterase I
MDRDSRRNHRRVAAMDVPHRSGAHATTASDSRIEATGSNLRIRGRDDGAHTRQMTVMRYVALGDSYTIGTSVGHAERWPEQLVARLADGPGPGLELVANLGVNGFTSADVIRQELPRLRELEPGFASLLVGVNDVIQGVTEDDYRRNVGLILDTMVDLTGSGRSLFVTTPDYTVTPAGADYGDPAHVAAAIRRFNEIGAGVARDRSVEVVDIHDLSLQAAADRSLVAVDGLHPSGLQYSLWVDRIQPVASALLGASRQLTPRAY